MHRRVRRRILPISRAGDNDYLGHRASLCRSTTNASIAAVRSSARSMADETGELSAAISSSVVRIRTEHHGRGPTRAKTYLFDDVILTVMEEGSAPVERTLAEAGDEELVQSIRARVQDAISEELKAAVEEISGRRVRAVVSGSQLELDIDCVVFPLEPDIIQPGR
jgi:uncharacterized protein YbcI